MTARARIAFHAGLATMAAASALGSVFDGFGWIFPVAGGIAIVVIVSELVRMSPLPALLGPILVAAAMTGYLTAAYAGSSAIAHFIPNGASMHVLASTARAGFHDIRTLGTPVPTHRGLILISIVGIAAVALVVDLIAVTMRRAALAGLPLLTIFALCTSIASRGAGWVPFVIGSFGYLWLLLADSRDRLARWGRPLGFEREGRPHFTWSDQEVMPSPLSVMGRRIGVSAIAIGLVVPLAIPGLRGGIPHGGGGGLGFGHGSSERFTVNPIVQIRGQLLTARARPVLSMQTTDPEPGYVRMTALDRFDGTTFSPSAMVAPVEAQVSRGINAPAVPGPTRRAEISIGALDVPWLPLPTQVTAVSVPGDWRYDRASNTVFSARSNTENISYSATFVSAQPTAAQLQQVNNTDPSVTRFLELPPLPNDVRELTARVVAKAQTPFDRALAIQRFLTSAPFVYDTSVPGDDSTHALSDFLLKTRRGFCQQYAAAMAVMARIARIPSRVAVGFTRGERQDDGSWLVSTHDAHAWPELYFSGFGWLPFEPTPRGDGQAVPPSYTVAQSTTHEGNGGARGNAGGGNDGKANSAAGKTKSQRFDDRLGDRDANGLPSGIPTEQAPDHTRRNVGLVLLAILGLALIAPSVARVVERRRRWRGARTPAEHASAAWAELRASAIDARAGWIDGLSPRATARVLEMESPAGFATGEVQALNRLVAAVQRAWYAADRTPRGFDSLEADVNVLRRAMLEGLTWGERFVVTAWPRSTLQSARTLLTRFSELLDAMDLGMARLRARLRPRHA